MTYKELGLKFGYSTNGIRLLGLRYGLDSREGKAVLVSRAAARKAAKAAAPAQPMIPDTEDPAIEVTLAPASHKPDALLAHLQAEADDVALVARAHRHLQGGLDEVHMLLGRDPDERRLEALQRCLRKNWLRVLGDPLRKLISRPYSLTAEGLRAANLRSL